MKQIYANNLTTLSLGRQGENLARQVVFDIRDLESLYGSGIVEVIHQRPGDAQPYPLAVQRDGTLVTWDVTATDTEMSAATANERYGKCELRYYAGETLAKSQIWRTWVESAMDTPSETAPPEPEQGWVDQVLAVGIAVKTAADGAKADADRAAALAAEVTEKAAQTAQDSSDASKSKDAANTAQSLAEKAQSAAEAAMTAADAAKIDAEAAQSVAAESASAAQQSARSAAESAAVYDNVVADVNQLKADVEHLAPTIVCEASGDVITLDDSCDRPFSGLNIYGKTTQDGTPSPDNPVELVSVGDGGAVKVQVTGKNLCPQVVYSAGLIASKGFILNKTPVTSPYTRAALGGVGVLIPVLQNETYTVSTDVTPNNYFTITYYKDFDIGSNSTANAISFKEYTNTNKATFTPPAGCRYVVITAVSNTTSEFTWSFWQVERGSRVTEYEPYTSQNITLQTPNGLPGIPVDSGGNYTDASGQQWICDEVDFERGVYVQRVLRKLFDGSETWIDGGTINGNVRPTNTFSEIIVNAPDSWTKISSFCDFYQLRSPTETWEEKIGYSVSDRSNSIQFYNSNFTTLSSWKAYLAENPVTCLLQLASPIETAISAEELAAYAALRTNYPNTTILNDSGAWMEIGYQTDTKLYIDKQFAELRNAIVSLGGNV